MSSTDNSVYGTGQFRLHYTNVSNPAQALLGPAYAFGNEAKITVNPEAEQSKIVRNNRGVNRISGNPTKEFKVSYEIEISELTYNGLARGLFMDQTTPSDNARSAQATQAIVTLDFRTSQSKTHHLDRWYDLSNSSLRFQHLNSAALTGALASYGAAADSTTLLEGTDYELDKVLGRVRFLKAIDDQISGSVNFSEITSSSEIYGKVQTPLAANMLSGIGVIDVWEDSELIWKHEGFACDLIPNGDIDFNSDLSTVKLRANAKVPMGNLFVR